MKKSLYVLNLYLWIHFIGFTEKFSSRRKSTVITAISLVFAAFNELNGLYFQFAIFQNYYQSNTLLNKKELFLFLLTSLESVQRFMLYFKRQRLNTLLKETAKIYLTLTRKSKLNLSKKVMVILIVNEVISAMVILIISLASGFFTDTQDAFYYGFIPPPHAETCYLISVTLVNWNLLTPAIAICFCFKCYMIKHIFIEYKKRMLYENMNVNVLFQLYTRITKLISSINDLYQMLLVNTFVILLGWVFYESYLLLFTKTDSNYVKVYRIIDVVTYFLRFVLICVCASSVTNIASSVKEMVYQLSVDVTDWKILRFVLKANDTFVGFKILDSVIINKQLIVFAVGSLFTYGIMIASFSLNEESK